MTKVTVYWKREPGDEERDASSMFAEYKVALPPHVDKGFLHLHEEGSKNRVLHIAVDQLAMWDEEEA